MWRHYDVIYVKTVKNGKICFKSYKFYRNIQFSVGLWQSFLEWISLGSKNKQTRNKNKILFFDIGWIAPHTFFFFFNDYPSLGRVVYNCFLFRFCFCFCFVLFCFLCGTFVWLLTWHTTYLFFILHSILC